MNRGQITYTPERVREWLTPTIGPKGEEVFEPYNALNLVLLAESYVAYAMKHERGNTEKPAEVPA